METERTWATWDVLEFPANPQVSNKGDPCPCISNLSRGERGKQNRLPCVRPEEEKKKLRVPCAVQEEFWNHKLQMQH